MTGILTYWAGQQSKIIGDKLFTNQSRKGTRHWEARDGEVITATKALPSEQIVELARWVDELTDAMSHQIERKVKAEAKYSLRDLATDGIMDRAAAISRLGPLSALTQTIMDPVRDAIRSAAQTQTAKLINRISQMDADGASLADIKAEIQQMTAKRADWNTKIATWATTNAIESARTKVYGIAGPKIKKTWITEHDTNVRASHIVMHEKTLPANQPFIVGGHPMMAPGDLAAPISETAGCRCYLSWSAV